MDEDRRGRRERPAGRGAARLAVLARCASAILALAWGALLSGAAGAQTPTTLVSNTGQSEVSIDSGDVAQVFTTGPNPTGYTLSDVRIRLDSTSSTSATGSVVKIFTYDYDNEEPGIELATLNNPATLTAGALNTFTVPGGILLAPYSDYWVVVNDGAADPITVSRTSSNAEGTAEEDWSIGDDGLRVDEIADSWSTVAGRPMRLSIRGSVNVVPPPYQNHVDADGAEVLWAATMTVGTDGTFYGFDRYEISESGVPVGSISGTPSFSYEGTTYFVDSILSDPVNNNLEFRADERLPQALVDKFALELDGAVYRLDEATLRFEIYNWFDAPFAWTENQTVSLTPDGPMRAEVRRLANPARGEAAAPGDGRRPPGRR